MTHLIQKAGIKTKCGMYFRRLPRRHKVTWTVRKATCPTCHWKATGRLTVPGKGDAHENDR